MVDINLKPIPSGRTVRANPNRDLRRRTAEIFPNQALALRDKSKTEAEAIVRFEMQHEAKTATNGDVALKLLLV